MIIARIPQKILIVLIFAACIFPCQGKSEQRGGRVEWGRLKTSDKNWDRHAETDQVMLNFIREHTTFDIEPYWHSADVEDLNQLCSYPLLYSQGIQTLSTTQAKKNLEEYLRRGGFLFIDACSNTFVTPDPDIFLTEQTAMFHEILPGSSIQRLPDDDLIYDNFFHIEGGLPHSYMENIYNPDWAKHGLYCVTFEERVIGLISLSGLKCGWAKFNFPVSHHIRCMQMMVNIYIYALAH